MPLGSTLLVLGAAASSLAPGGDDSGEARVRDTLRVDAVELVDHGQDVPGRGELGVEHLGYRYLFADEANRGRFLEDPERYEIQLGGSCARMGPLSSAARTAIHVVYEERLYLFASEACRTVFLAAPERLLEVDEPAPAATRTERMRGEALLELVVQGLGGRERVDGVQSLVERQVEDEGHESHAGEPEGEEPSGTESGSERTFVFPDRMRLDTWYGEWSRASVVTARDAWYEEAGAEWTLHASQRRALEHKLLRHPLVLARLRARPGFLAAHAGRETWKGREVELLRTSYRGATTTLGVDAASGRVLFARYRGRGRGAWLGALEVGYGDHRSLAGLELPVTLSVSFDGQPDPSSSFTWTAIEVDRPLDPRRFLRRD